jgi:hypothetical protein
VKVDPDIALLADDRAQFGKLGDGVIDPGLVLDDARVATIEPGRAGLEGGEALGPLFADQFRGAGVGIDSDALAGRAAEQLIDRHTEQLSLDIPERLIDTAQRRGQDRATTIEGVAIDRLPVMGDIARILADQIGLHLADRLGAGSGPSLGDRLTKTDHARIGMDLQKEPARLDQKCLELGDFDALTNRVTRRGVWVAVAAVAVFSHFDRCGSRILQRPPDRPRQQRRI